MKIENIVIIPSSVSPNIGVFTAKQRFEQTLLTIETARKYIPNSFIILNDISLVPAENLLTELNKNVDVLINSSENLQALYYSKNGWKSPGELVLFCTALNYIKDNMNIANIQRIFKLGARVQIKPTFKIEDHGFYDNKKYTFKSLPSWMDNSTKLYITRLWSMHASLIDDYLTKSNNLMECFSRGFDTEHSHFKVFNNNTLEINELNVECFIAPNGSLHVD